MANDMYRWLSFWNLIQAESYKPSRWGALTIYTVPRVCQHKGCDFDKKCKRKGMFFGQKCKRKGVLGQRMNYSMTTLENFRRHVPFFSSIVQKRVLFGKMCKKNSVFLPKNARERVSFS